MDKRTKHTISTIVREARGNALFIVTLTIAVGALSPEKAHAYLDAGTGSYVIQIVIASLAAALFSIKLWWRRIVATVSQMWQVISKHDNHERK